MKVLLIADHLHGEMKPATSQAVTAVGALGAPIDVLVAGAHIEAVGQACARISGVERVLSLSSEAFHYEAPELLAKLVAKLAEGYTHVFFISSSLGKAAMPRAAALLDVSPVSDVLEVLGEKKFVRAIYAGSLLSEVEVDEEKVVATIRTSAFAPAPAGAAAPIEAVSFDEEEEFSRFLKLDETKSDRPELVSAKVVVAGGNGIGESGFGALSELADVLGAAVGGTRTAVDNGLCPNDWQIGQTGKVIAPDLYICAGVSGAIQHTAGIKDAKVIVAVNTDEDAPIFEVADYGIVADGETVVRELSAKLRA